MENSRTWKDKIVQITVCNGGELIMVPREGSERFHFGQPEDIQDKFRKMETYYTAIVPAKGEKEYSMVNLEYEGQIVCR
jgi:cell division protein FtsQ